ncbi:MAG: KOW motif-containing protein, partial [Bacteroidales bacterium]|nr:KOW motif-containing protein [Bacteroidales bacterium]
RRIEIELEDHPDVSAALLIPKRELEERKGGVVRKVQRVMFPGYVLAGTEDIIKLFQITYRVDDLLKILRHEGVFREIRLDEISQIVYMADGDGVIGISDMEFDEGNHVHVLAGPLKGYDGWITKVDRRKQRAKVRFAFDGLWREIWLSVRLL